MDNRKGEVFMLKVKEGSRGEVSLNDHIADYIKADQEFMEGIRRGAKDCKAGRVQLWSEVKKELHIR